MKNRNLLIILLIIIGVSLFYWFQWRPREIRKNCEYQVFSKNNYSINATGNNHYRQCLVENGLPPESIFVNIESSESVFRTKF